MCADLRGGWAEDTVGEVEKQARELKALKKDIASYRCTIASARQELSASFALLKQMQQLSLRLVHIKEYLPQHMPRPATRQQKPNSKKAPSEEDAAQVSQLKVRQMLLRFFIFMKQSLSVVGGGTCHPLTVVFLKVSITR